MKRVVNGVEVELAAQGLSVRRVEDRLLVYGPEGARSALVIRKGDAVHVSYQGRQYLVEPVRASRGTGTAVQSGELRSPMPGQVVDVAVEEGEAVVKGQKLLVLEAMKTQQTFSAPFDGRIAKLLVSKNEQIGEGSVMVVVEPVEEKAVE